MQKIINIMFYISLAIISLVIGITCIEPLQWILGEFLGAFSAGLLAGSMFISIGLGYYRSEYSDE